MAPVFQQEIARAVPVFDRDQTGKTVPLMALNFGIVARMFGIAALALCDCGVAVVPHAKLCEFAPRQG